ncbi:MAG: hypothetical protein R6U51_12845 [Anaerolineales bacterium]
MPLIIYAVDEFDSPFYLEDLMVVVPELVGDEALFVNETPLGTDVF